MKFRTAILCSWILLSGLQSLALANDSGTGDPQIDAILLEAGNLQNQGESGAGAQRAEAAARIAKERYGEDHPIYGTALYYFGTLSMFAQNFGTAQKALQESLDIRSANFGENSIEVAHTLQSLGLLSISQSRADESKRYLSKAAEIYEKIPGGSKYLPHVRHKEALAVSPSADPSVIEQAWRKVIDAIEHQASPDDRDLDIYTASLNNLGTVLSAQGKSREAIDVYEKALQLTSAEEAGQPSLQLTFYRSAIYRELGMEYEKMGQIGQAREAYALSWRKAELGSIKGRWVAGSSLSKLAALEIDADELKSAEIHLRRALEIMKDHPAEGEAKAAIEDLMETIKKKSGETSG